MRKIIRDYLTFNKRERNGVFVLLFIIVLLIVYLNISHHFIKEPTVDFTKFKKEVELLQGSVSQQANAPQKYNTEKEISKVLAERFDFNPNNLPDAGWKKLGLNDKQILTIKKYEAKGGKFRTKEDVKKMYCISEKLYLSLEQYIQIPSLSPFPKTEGKLPLQQTRSDQRVKVRKEASTIEINVADSIQLLRLKGIGAFYAKTIINYRNALGGFFGKEQLMEVWKLDQKKYDEIKDLITVDDSRIKKININNCKASELKHPYLKWNVVNAIINYRDKHGKYASIEEIKKTDLVDEATYLKIKPYLVVE